MKKRINFNIQINFTNRAIYTFVAFILILIIGVAVYAFGTSTPSTFGHSAGELDLSGGVSGNAIFNDNVGIGTASPGEKLTVVGTTRVDRLNVLGGGYGVINVMVNNNNEAGLSLHYPGVIAWQLGRRGSSLSIATTGGAATDTMGTDRVTITSSGNVGIGKTNPTQKLDVAGNIVGDNFRSVSCPSGQFVQGFSASGNIICNTDQTGGGGGCTGVVPGCGCGSVTCSGGSWGCVGDVGCTAGS